MCRTCSDKLLEKGQHGAGGGEEHFGVPLNAHDKTIAGHFNSFYDVIGSGGSDFQALPQAVQTLVVETIDFKSVAKQVI